MEVNAPEGREASFGEPSGAPLQSNRNAVIRLGNWIVQRLERLIARCSSVPDAPFLDAAHFPWAAELEARSDAIREELDAVLDRPLPGFAELSASLDTLDTQGAWDVFFLLAYGYRVEEARALCPRTAEALDAVPGLQTAFFSVLRPGAHLPLHRGPYKGVVRYHLGLVVPDDARACRIQVGGIERHWEVGRGMFFDDSYPHQVWNDTPQTRVVLFLDVERPMRFPADALNRAIIRAIGVSPFIRDFRRRHRRWARGFFTEGSAAATSAQSGANRS